MVHHLKLYWNEDLLFDLTSGTFALFPIFFFSLLCNCYKISNVPSQSLIVGTICINTGWWISPDTQHRHFLIHVWATGGSRTYGAQAEHARRRRCFCRHKYCAYCDGCAVLTQTGVRQDARITVVTESHLNASSRRPIQQKPEPEHPP